MREADYYRAVAKVLYEALKTQACYCNDARWDAGGETPYTCHRCTALRRVEESGWQA